MSVIDTKHSIKAALENFRSGNLSNNAINLFKTLGYNTERQAPFEKKNYDSFKSSFVEGNSRFSEEKAMISEWKYVDLLFQLSHEEITKQYSAFKKEVVTKEDGSKIAMESFLFFVIELKSETYSRSVLSHMTREVNKLFPMPAIVLFKQGLSLILAVINRRLHKRDESKDVLEKVTFIKDINIEIPHRAHIEILFDLSFEELLSVYKFTNFVELHSAWQKTLDTKELNKKFYKELSNWYFWAMDEVYFPGAALHADKNSLFKKEDKEKEHNAKNLIRLLTRLLFVWFIKEKGLIPEEFFDEKYIAGELLKNFKPKKDRSGSLSTISCYYRAIMQNLFFATLNQDMGKREFRKPGQHMNVTNLLRYERYFKDPNKYIKLVEKTTPFMNGGLFECLDIPDPEKRGRQGGDVIIYQDGFSDRDDNQLKVPDYIFFGTKEHVDLSEAYGDKSKEYKNAAIKGLINILKSYKFTVAENTPLEEEIALDPELLGRVFENLLASYNPETKTTARKQTGSFYTPREIVNYMVDESLIAYLKQKLEDADIQDREESLRDLVSYSENPNPFNEKETTLLISAIDSSKILDPACGSGAFPMGILHKLVHILHKLDPRNELWEQKQIEKARAQDDPAIRDQLIADIEAAFENNELDYGRKLYLIENCIYGVDIQPIATQISKLRFFISLIVDQKVDIKKENFGVRPLPNLETKFVSANTLLGIEKPEAQMSFGSAGVKALEEKLKDIRHRLFSAKTPSTKRKLREEDKLIREQMGNVLVKSGWKNEAARLLANWDPYDQNASSPFFDPEWMFGITDGFNVVIGNPPYISFYSRQAKELEEGMRTYFQKNYIFLQGMNKKSINTVMLFLEKGIRALNATGQFVYIIDIGFFEKVYKEIRKFLSCYDINLIMGNLSAFENVASGQLILMGKHIEISPDNFNCAVFADFHNRIKTLSYDDFIADTLTIDHDDASLTFKEVVPLVNLVDITCGLEFGALRDLFLSDSKVNINYHKALFGGQNIPNKYELVWSERDGYVLFDKNYEQELVRKKENYSETGKYVHFISGDESKYLEDKLLIRQSAMEIIAAYDNSKYYAMRSIFLVNKKTEEINLKYILGLLNSKLISSYALKSGIIRYQKGKQPQIRVAGLEQIPIKVTSSKNEEVLKSLVDYVLFLIKDKSEMLYYFKYLIDAMVYELYLFDKTKTVGCEVLKHLTNLPELKDDWSDERKLVTIEGVYKELSDPKHPVSVAMSKMQEVPEVKIIEGKV